MDLNQHRLKTKQLLDFEVDRGTNPVILTDLNILFSELKRPDLRVYFILLAHSLRPAEPFDITWHNFVDGKLIFRPNKQRSRNLLRKIKISPRAWEELMEYRDNNFFPKNGKLFPFTSDNMRAVFNKQLRPKLKGIWQKKSGNLRAGTVAQFYHYTLQSFRCMAATMVYHYYSKVYGHGDLALTLTCKFMGHSAEKMTAQYYVKRIDHLRINDFPEIPMLDLLDYVIYNKRQHKITEFLPERNSLIMEY